MPQITITVTGDRGAGKTVTAMRLVRFLRLFGFDVAYRGRTREQTKLIERDFDRGQPLVGAEPLEILVVDET